MTTFTTGPSDRLVGERVVRFDRAERYVHWVSSALVLVALATGTILYVGPLAVAVGRRDLVKDVHVITGLGGLVPFLVAMAGPWRAGLRRDIDRFANWHDDDLRWFRRRFRATSETGKFSGGQKLNAVLASSALVVMAMTGSIMKWFGPFPLEWRTGATFVHDWVSFGLWFLIGAHIVKAVTTPGALRGMVTGWVRRDAAQTRSRWWAELDAEPGASPDTGDDSPADRLSAVDVRIGVTYTAKELDIDLGDAEPDAVQADVDAAVTGDTGILWLTDKKGRRIGVPTEKIAYVEIGSSDAEKRIGFGT